MASQSQPLRGVNRFAWVTAVATFFLVGLGGMVTSEGVGMSVPDWPNSYGYNMFLLPWSMFSPDQGGVFWEHSHRLKGSVVGLLTMVLAAWLWFADTSPAVKKLGVLAFIGVVVQGVLGGFRVVFDSQVVGGTTFGVVFGVFHAALGQLFFTLVCLLVFLTSKTWRALRERAGEIRETFSGFRMVVLVTTLLIFGQLLLGATMRHQHAGLAISDFPLAYGKLWPDMSAEAVAGYNQARNTLRAFNDITPFQILLQMAHRLVAYTLCVMVAACWWKARKSFPQGHVLRRLAAGWLGLILVQAALGVFTLWSDKAADVATAHVAVGAFTLMFGAVFSVVAFQLILPRESGKLRRSSTAVPSDAVRA